MHTPNRSMQFVPIFVGVTEKLRNFIVEIKQNYEAKMGIYSCRGLFLRIVRWAGLPPAVMGPNVSE